jgi:NAD(P)-dependent dehydrogenase (short-subunit alcohol dehydrogenase family)
MKLKGKVAVVTGGAGGIGSAICLALAREGANVVINYYSKLDQKSANIIVEKIKAMGREAISVKADVTKKKEIDNMISTAVKKFGKIDILVNVAGICPFVDFFSITEKIWDRVFAVNTKSIFFVSQAAAKVMIDKKIKGRIINITSISGEKATSPLQIPYCASKGAANMLTKVMAVALAPYNITVNAVLPGTIETNINKKVLADKKVRDSIIKATPLKCLGETQDIAEAVMYFASDEAKWTTGSLLVVDGGFIA